MGNTQILIDLIKPLQNIAGSMIAIHYVTPAHIIGGLLIVFGLLARWFSAITTSFRCCNN